MKRRQTIFRIASRFCKLIDNGVKSICLQYKAESRDGTADIARYTRISDVIWSLDCAIILSCIILTVVVACFYFAYFHFALPWPHDSLL